MFRSTSTHSHRIGPVQLDWTTRELLEWIGTDDARCHDETLLGLLAATDAALAARGDVDAPRSSLRNPIGAVPAVKDPAKASVLTPRSAAPLVRALAARLREQPALRDARLSELVPALAVRPTAVDRAVDRAQPDGVAAGQVAASVRAPRLQVG